MMQEPEYEYEVYVAPSIDRKNWDVWVRRNIDIWTSHADRVQYSFPKKKDAIRIGYAIYEAIRPDARCHFRGVNK